MYICGEYKYSEHIHIYICDEHTYADCLAVKASTRATAHEACSVHSAVWGSGHLTNYEFI